MLLLFGQSIFRLRDLKLSTSVQGHETHTKVGSTWVLVRFLFKGVDSEQAHQGRVPDIPQSLPQLAIRTRKWGS